MSNDVELPYIVETVITHKKHYNPKYGNDRTCVCDHPYHRHFDSYEQMSNVGCKYCQCRDFEELKSYKK